MAADRAAAGWPRAGVPSEPSTFYIGNDDGGLKGQPLAELNRSLRGSNQPALILAGAVAPPDWNAGWITTNRDEEAE